MKNPQILLKKYRWILLIIDIVIFLYLRNKDGSSYVPPVEGAEYISGCEKMVLDRIKSPSTAVFSDIIYVAGDANVDSKLQYSILGTLDSQNSFGGMMRGKFGCQKNWGEDMTVTVAD